MKALFIIAFSVLIIISPLAVGNSNFRGQGELQFEKSPAFNFTLSNQKISINFFSPQFANANGRKIMSNLPDVNSSNFPFHGSRNNKSFGMAIKESFKEHVRGQLNVSYNYYIQEEILKLNLSEMGFSQIGQIMPLTMHYLFINMTINICTIKTNSTITENHNHIFIGTNNTLRVVYTMNIHSTSGGRTDIIIPTLFSSTSRGIGMENFSGALRSNSMEIYNGLNFNITNNRNLHFLFNDSYMENGMTKNLKVVNSGKNGSQLNALSFIFISKGKYSNITYDPYISLPLKNLFKNVTVKYITSSIVGIILENSLFLSVGMVAGVAIIGSGYIYRKRKI